MATINEVEKLAGVVLIDMDQIKARREPMPEVKCGIYFLFVGDELVYVGQSANVIQRIHGHEKRRYAIEEITSWAFAPCAREDLLAIEALYIGIYRPRLNGPK